MKSIALLSLSIFLISCSNPISPMLDPSKPSKDAYTSSEVNSRFKQVGKTYLAMESEVWDVVDGRYSFKRATTFNKIIIDSNYTFSPHTHPLAFHDGNFIYIDRDTLGRHSKYTSTNGVQPTNKTSITFDAFMGYTEIYTHGAYISDDNFMYLIAFLDRSKLSDTDTKNILNHTLLIYKSISPNNFNNFRLVNTHFIRGATDSWHTIVFNKDTKKYYIYGRKRTEWDWGPFPSSNEFLRLAMPDRRGIRILEAEDIEGNWVELSPIDPINYQTEYTNPSQDIRMDYYGGSGAYYFGNVLLQINTFFKDKNRVPSTRPERISGTGPLYPTLWHSSDGREFKPAHPTMARSLVPLFLHKRDWSRYFEETSGYFEVGQIYSAPFIVKDTLVYMFYRNRQDTHYLHSLAGSIERPDENWGSVIVLDRFSSYQPLDVSCTSIPYYGKQSGISDNKCLPSTITTKVLQTPEGSNAVGINVNGNFTLRVFNENMELIDEVTDITTDQVSYIFKPKYDGLPKKAIIQIELFSGDFYAVKFFRETESASF